MSRTRHQPSPAFASVRARAAAILWAGALACSGGGPIGDGTDTSDSDSGSTDDTYVPPAFDTGDGNGNDSGDSGDTQDSSSNDSDSGFNGGTGLCLFGEVPDCTGTCYPQHLIGDGFCDDGSSLPADFNCAASGFDGGDCNNNGPAGCEYAILFTPRIFASEIYWDLRTPTGASLAGVQAGTYTTSGRTYRTDITLGDGTYVFDGRDTYGDGWHRATWQLVDVRTGKVVFQNDPDDFLAGTGSPPGDRFQWTCDVTCERTSGEVDVRTIVGPAAADMGWEMWSVLDATSPQLLTPVVTASPGSLSATGTRRVDLYEAMYELRSRDPSSQGWRGGKVEVEYDDGWISQVGGLADNARTDATRFRHTCDLHNVPPLQASIPTLSPSSCVNLTFETQPKSGTANSQIGWELRREDTFTQIRGFTPGTVSDTTTAAHTSTSTLRSGLHLLRLEDRGNNGWAGATFRLIDPDSSVLFTTTLPTSSTGVARFTLDCPPEDTGNPSDTDSDAGPTCLDGAVPDCRGVCMPDDFLGDGTCDDGIASSADFACAAFGFDEGDCPGGDTDTDTDTDDSDPADSDTADSADSDTADSADSDTADSADSDTADSADSDTADSGDSDTADSADSDTADSGDSDTADSTDSDTADSADSADSDTSSAP